MLVLSLISANICSKVRFRGTIGHPYTPHKFIVCDKRLNIMSCPGNTCYDNNANNCIQCKDDREFNIPLFDLRLCLRMFFKFCLEKKAYSLNYGVHVAVLL